MQYIKIKNFETFQHYKGRRPVWIKLYNALLDDFAYARLQDASKAHLVGLWLLASRTDNKIPYDLPFIAQTIRATSAVDIDELVNAGFIEVYDASKPLADRKPGASLEKRRGEKRRGEKNPPQNDAAGEPFDLAPYIAAYTERFPGSTITGGRLGKTLKALEAKHERDETLRRWRIFLAAKGELGVEYFGRTWSEWAGGPAIVRPTVARRGAVLLDLFRRYDLFTYNGNADEYRAKLDRAASDPAAPPTLREDVAAIRPARGEIAGANDHFKAVEIESRLARQKVSA